MQIWVKRTKGSPKITFFPIFSNLVHKVFFNLPVIIAWDNYQLLVELKLAVQFYLYNYYSEVYQQIYKLYCSLRLLAFYKVEVNLKQIKNKDK